MWHSIPDLDDAFQVLRLQQDDAGATDRDVVVVAVASLHVMQDAQSGSLEWLQRLGCLALAFSAYSLSSTPLSVYSNSDFWLNSPALILIKLGAILILIAFAWLWNVRTSARDWSWVRQFGLTSLLVYWVHVELIYGRWFGMLKEQLTVGQTIFAILVTVLLMLGLSLIRTNWTQVRSYFASSNAGLPRRVSGD